MFRSLRHYLRSQSQGHYTIDRLEERVAEKGSARRSSLKGQERAIVCQTNAGTVSKATLEKRLRDWMERIYYGLFRVYKYYLELNNQLVGRFGLAVRPDLRLVSGRTSVRYHFGSPFS